MLQEEKTSTSNMDEIYARNVVRLKSRYRGTELKSSSATGADEEDFIDTKLYEKQTHLTQRAIQEREASRQIHQHKTQLAVTSKCWWWMESSQFRKHMLLSLGNHVSLVMAPAQRTISGHEGYHHYIVPIKVRSGHLDTVPFTPMLTLFLSLLCPVTPSYVPPLCDNAADANPMQPLARRLTGELSQ